MFLASAIPWRKFLPIRRENFGTRQARGIMPAVLVEIPFAGAAKIQCPHVD